MTEIILTQTTKDDLISEITNNVLSGMATIMRESRESELYSKEWLSTKETESLLKISNVTRWNWTNSGVLTSYKIGNRLRYRKDEVIQSLLKLENKKGLK